MQKNRIEAFSDGVIAIIITIMVLEMKVPHSTELSSLVGLIPVLISYVLSFVYFGIYWNNHHHLFQAVRQVDGLTLWANLHLLFWLSLLPFATGWMGENHFELYPVALYGVVLLMTATSYLLLVLAITHNRANADVHEALGKKRKEIVSIVLFAVAVAIAFANTWTSEALYVLVAALWFVPDPRIERKRTKHATD